MSQSLARVLVHLVFSTKGREPQIDDEIREELHAYIGGIIENHRGTLLKAGSVRDHIHLLLAHPRDRRSLGSGEGNQDQFGEVDKNERKAVCPLSMAKRLWPFLDRPFAPAST